MKFLQNSLHFLFRRAEIFNQIDNYYAWKIEKYPLVAKSDRDYLWEFAKKMKVKSVREITEQVVIEFLKEKYTEYQVKNAKRVIRTFIRYHLIRGYHCMNVARNKVLC